MCGIWVCLYLYYWLCTCMEWRPGVSTECLLCHFSPIFWDRVAHGAKSSPCQLDWLDSKHLRSSQLCPLVVGNLKEVYRWCLHSSLSHGAEYPEYLNPGPHEPGTHYPLCRLSIPLEDFFFFKVTVRISPVLPMLFIIDRLHRQKSKKLLKNMLEHVCHVGMCVSCWNV